MVSSNQFFRFDQTTFVNSKVMRSLACQCKHAGCQNISGYSSPVVPIIYIRSIACACWLQILVCIWLNIPRSDVYKLQIAMMYEIVHRNGELFAQLDALFGTKQRINCNVLSLVWVIVNIGWVPLFFPTHFVGCRHNICIYIFIYSLLFFFRSFSGGPFVLVAICSTLAVILFCRSLFFMCNSTRCVKCVFDRSENMCCAWIVCLLRFLVFIFSCVFWLLLAYLRHKMKMKRIEY